eukprot:jgi/Botrbrau1/2300/Bobra.101_2s0121.1
MPMWWSTYWRSCKWIRFIFLAHDLGRHCGSRSFSAANSTALPPPLTPGTSRGVDILSAGLLNGGLFPELHRARLSQKVLAGRLGPLLSAITTFRTLKRAISVTFGPETQPSEGWVREAYAGLAFNEGRLISHRLIFYMAERRQHRDRWVGVLAKTKVLLAFINGPADPISGRHVAQHLLQHFPHVRVVLLSDGIGHYPQVEAPEQVLAAYKEFRESLRSPEGLA